MERCATDHRGGASAAQGELIDALIACGQRASIKAAPLLPLEQRQGAEEKKRQSASLAEDQEAREAPGTHAPCLQR